MNFVQFPDIIPSSMDFVAPRFPVGSDTSLGGVSSRRKFGNRQYDGRLTVEFRNISNYLCAQVLLTCINSKGLAPIAFYESFFRGAGDDLKLFLDGSAYPGLLWYFIEDSPPRINRVEGGAEVSNMSMELAARLMPDSTGSSTTPILPAPLPTPGGPGGGTVQPTQYVTSISAEAPLSSTGGANPVLSLPMATQTADGAMSKGDKLKLDNIEVGAQPNVPTNLAYTPSTRLLASSTGDDVTLPLVSSTDPGLAPSSGGGTTNFLRADGTWTAPSQSSTDLSYISSTRLLQSSTGSDVTLPLVSSSDAGLAPATGGGTSNFLRADGTWAQPPGGSTDLGYTPSTRLLTSSSGADVTLPLVSSSDAGLAPSSGGGTTNFLRADGTWTAPPQSQTDLTYTASTRLLQSSTGNDVTLPLVSSSDAGLAPSSGGGTTNFLRADGTWTAPPQSSTDLSYTPSTRLLQSSTGNDATLPLVSSGDAGLAPASGGGTSNYLRADGTWAQPPGTGVSASTLTHTTGSLAAGASADFTLSSNSLFQLLSFTASTPAWIRVYGTSAARAADTRTSPGGTLPLAGSEYYAELATTTAPQTIRLSPVPLVQPTAGLVYLRVQNTDTVTRTLTLQFSILSFNS